MRLLRALLWVPLLLASTLTQAQSPAVSEQALKAVLFYKLPLFVYANASANSSASDKRKPINICTLGDSPLGNAVEKLPRTLADGRRVDLRALAGNADSSECEFLFIGRSEADNIDTLLRRIQGRRLVTVSDIEGFAQSGGIVEFSLRSDGSGVLILINRKAAQKQGIEFNAQLLRLARIVEP
jgi:hypothetical protein